MELQIKMLLSQRIFREKEASKELGPTVFQEQWALQPLHVYQLYLKLKELTTQSAQLVQPVLTALVMQWNKFNLGNKMSSLLVEVRSLTGL